MPADQGEPPAGRYAVVVVEGPPRGDLYELEQTTTFSVVERLTGRVVLIFHGTYSASLDRDSGLWAKGAWVGVRSVALAPDGRAVLATYADGHEERLALPEPPLPSDG